MFTGYFNYSQSVAEGYWQRHAFVRHWWGVYRGDRRWAPPHFPTFYRTIVRGQNQHLARLQPRFIRLEALQDTRRTNDKGFPRFSSPLWETTVAAAVLLTDPRRQDRTVYLGMLHCVNDVESIRRFTGLALEQAAQAGAFRLVGPTGLSPHLQSGVLQDHFNRTPPLHTPYNPPYVPEVMQGALYPLRTRALFCIDTSSAPDDSAPEEKDDPPVGSVHVQPMISEPMEAGFPSLFMRTFDPGASSSRPAGASIDFPPPDEAETAFILNWVSVWPTHVLLAVMDDEPVGFVMLQPDMARAVARAQGGRNPLWRPWLALRSRRPAKAGRLLYIGVLPAYRNRGIGSQLWHRAVQYAHDAGWRTLTLGPLPLSDPVAAFARKRGAQPQQTYRLYTTEL